MIKFNARKSQITIAIQGDIVSISDGDMTYTKKAFTFPYVEWEKIVGSDKEINTPFIYLRDFLDRYRHNSAENTIHH